MKFVGNLFRENKQGTKQSQKPGMISYTTKTTTSTKTATKLIIN